MTEKSNSTIADDYQTPSKPTSASVATSPSAPMAYPGHTSLPEKSASDYYPVQGVSRVCVPPVQLPVQRLSTDNLDRGYTDSEQGVNSSNEHTLNRAMDRGVNTPSGHGVDRLNGQTPNTQNDPSEPPFILLGDMTVWTANQNRLLDFFRRCRHCITSHKAIGEKFNIPYGTVRNIIRRLTSSGHIRTAPYKQAAMQGIEVWYLGSDSPLPGVRSDAAVLPIQAAPEQAKWTGGEQLSYMEDRKIENIKRNQSIWDLSKEQIRALWPHVCEAGLYASHLQEIRDALALQGIENQPEKIVAQSLRFLDWQLAKGPIIDQHGNAVTHPVSYWRAAMKRNGFYQKPADYMDPEEQALRQLADEENARNAALRALQQAQTEKEKQERLDELNGMLQQIAEQTTEHPLWAELSMTWSSLARQEIEKNPQTILTSPGIAATTRIALRELFGFPRD